MGLSTTLVHHGRFRCRDNRVIWIVADAGKGLNPTEVSGRGIHSSLLKSMLCDEFLTILRRVAAGEDVIHPFVAKKILRPVHRGGHLEPGLFISLTGREMEIIRVLAEGGNNARIPQNLYVSESTVKSHISNLFWDT